MPAWIKAGCAEYIKRMPRELPLSLVELKPEERGSKNREQLLLAEKERLLIAIKDCARFVVLDERGEDVSSVQLAQKLQTWQEGAGDTAFLIGSADGIHESMQQKAQAKIRLSALTFPHSLARLLLCEQLYRAVSILKNHPYHREG